MPYLLGTDEAGYGPNIGPLVVTATLWRVPDDADETLYGCLRRVVHADPQCEDPRRLLIADSKAVYSPAGGLARLETGALAALRVCGLRPTNLRELLRDAAGIIDGDELTRPWHAEVEIALPRACDAGSLDGAASRLDDGLREAGVRLLAVRSRCLFPAGFNGAVKRLGNKSTLLTEMTLLLVRELLDGYFDDAAADDDGLVIACDKHGGRNAYAAALQQYVVDDLVQTVCESRGESVYRFRRAERAVEIGFRVNGESRMPTALASMISKYVREAAMCAWNAYWLGLVPELRPTAGYPGDARRFRREIAATARERSLHARLWWRDR